MTDSGTNSNKVQGNIIGLNAAGTAAIPNQFEGIAIFGTASSNTIGGTTAASPNIISGNIGSGISISGTGTKLNKVQHNLIGTNLPAPLLSLTMSELGFSAARPATRLVAALLQRAM